MWPFGKSLVQQGHEALDRVEKRIDGLIKSEQEARARVAQLEMEAAENRAKIAEQSAKLRQQTDADLYLASAKIMRDILETGKAKPVEVAAQSQLQHMRDMQMRQQAASGNISGYGNYGMGALGYLGLQ